MRQRSAPTTQNLPSCCQLRTERSDATRRGRGGWTVAAGRATVDREGSASFPSGCGNTRVLLRDERLDRAVGREQEVVHLATEQVAQGSRAVPVEVDVLEQ